MISMQRREVPTLRCRWNMVDGFDKRLAEAMLRNSDWRSSFVPEASVPAVDVREETDHYLLEAELPGIRKEEVEVTAGDGVLEISAKHEVRQESEKEGYIRRERRSNLFFRRLAIPEDVDPEGIKARLEDGVLQVTLLKRPSQVEKRAKVEVQ